VIRRVVRVYEQVETGPNYRTVAGSMATYRSIAARMQNAKASTQNKLDVQIERLNELIGERLGELTHLERSALTCWQDGSLPGTYELDHQATTERPYISIRKVQRWDEVQDADQTKSSTTDTPSEAETQETKRQLDAFLKLP